MDSHVVSNFGLCCCCVICLLHSCKEFLCSKAWTQLATWCIQLTLFHCGFWIPGKQLPLPLYWLAHITWLSLSPFPVLSSFPAPITTLGCFSFVSLSLSSLEGAPSVLSAAQFVIDLSGLCLRQSAQAPTHLLVIILEPWGFWVPGPLDNAGCWHEMYSTQEWVQTGWGLRHKYSGAEWWSAICSSTQVNSVYGISLTTKQPFKCWWAVYVLEQIID